MSINIVFYRKTKSENQDLFTMLREKGYFCHQYPDDNNKGVVKYIKNSKFNRSGKKVIKDLMRQLLR